MSTFDFTYRPTTMLQGAALPVAHEGGPGWVHRSVDVVGVAMGVWIVLPIIAVCAAWIYLMDGRPIFYQQWRVGRDGWLFRIYKLRSMRKDAEKAGARFAERSDPRVLPGCGLMRRMHIDELPQLWNIAKGQMSLVGPRPERPEMHEQIREQVPGFDRRLMVRPGLTGRAQLRQGYSNDMAGARRKLADDLRYLRRRSIREDVRLIIATVTTRLWDRGAC